MEEIDSKNASSLKLPQMSERQAILYLEKSSSNLINPFNSESRTEVLDYHKYYLFKKKQREKELPKEKLEERKRLYQLSLKEYTPIKKSIYMDRKKKNTYDYEDSLQCICKPNLFTPSEVEEILRTQYKDKTEEELFGCIEGCQNRAIFLECDENCRCGASCRNRVFQRQEYADVYPIKTENRGWGLCAGSDIKKDTFIMQYIGEIYSLDSEYGKKKLKEYKDKDCTYLMDLPGGSKHEVIDPTKKGNMARFINHSCDPNCETRKWHVKSELCIGIFAKRDIKEDEELTFNYDFDLNKTRYQKCLCGAKNCRGYLGISTEDNKKVLNKSLVCGICKENCKHSESIIDCKDCGKFFHKKCAKKKGQLSSNNNEYKCAHCLKKSSSGIYAKNNDNNIIKEKIKLDEEPIYDEILEIGIEDLQKVKKNLKDLIIIGAKMFWDFQSENAILGTDDKIELKISGTTKQIEGVKEAIKQLKLKKEGTNEYNIKLQVPKIFIRKIIGHQYRNLDSYKSKYGVQILYDTTLITDDIFPIQEYTTIEIKGKESNVKAVAFSIKHYLCNLKVISIYLLEEDYFTVRQKICNLKNSADPADLRLRKLDSKNEREIKHPFYYISNNMKDIVIIGFENEVEKARLIIKNFLLIQNNLSFIYSLNILFPIYFKLKLNDFIRENLEEVEKNKIKIIATDPEYLRRHISVNIRGNWPSITQTKTKLWNYLKNYAINTIPKKHDINEFEQYAYNQEHKLISKSIRTYIIEQSPQIKNWDYISDDIEYLQQKYFDQKLIGQSSPDRKKEGSDVIDNFVYTIDKETRINYLINMRPGAYKKVFNMTQNDLLGDMMSVLEETYNSYQSSKLENNTDIKSEDYGYSERDKTYKNDDGFAEPMKINSALFHQNDKYNNISYKNPPSDYDFNNYDSNKKKYIDNPNIPFNNPLNNFSGNKKPYIDSQKSNLSTNNHSNPSSQYKMSNNYKNNNGSNSNLQKINSFMSPLDRNLPNTSGNYQSKYDNYGYYQRKENNDNSSNSSFLLRKTNRPDSRSPSERRRPGNNTNNYYDKEMKGYQGKYKNYFRNYDKEYDSYDKRKNSPYSDNYYEEPNKYNHSNEYPKYNDRDRDRGKERDVRRDIDRDHDRDRDRGREMNSWYRKDSPNKNNIEERHGIGYRNNFDGHASSNNNSYMKDNNYNYRNNYKESYRNYPPNNRENNYSGRNNSGNEIKNNDNRYSGSKYYYDDGYNRKRFFNDNNYIDKRKSEYKGNSSNYMGNKYSDREERSRSRSKSWGRNHSRYRKDVMKRERSHSKSFHKFNDNYE